MRKTLAAGALPVVLGGDHSIKIPCVSAFAEHGPIHIVQIDAHLDFVDERHGVRFSHGNPIRRAAEQAHVSGLSQFGIRNVSSTAKDGYDAARAMGSDILSVRHFRKLGVAGALARVPSGGTIISPSTSTASIRPSRPGPARLPTADFYTTRSLSSSTA